jgi:hypothetical protein
VRGRHLFWQNQFDSFPRCAHLEGLRRRRFR